MGLKPGIKGVTLPGRSEGVPGIAALKVTTRRGGGGRRRDELWRCRSGSETSCGCRPEAPPSPVPRARGGDSWPDPALRCTPRNPLTFTISRCGRGRRQPARGCRTPHQLLPNPLRSAGHPMLSGPRRDALTPVFRPASPAGDLPHRRYRGRTAAATHLAQQQEPFSEGVKKRKAAGGSRTGVVGG